MPLRHQGRQTRKKGIPRNPGPAKCSPLSKSKKADKSCLPPDVKARLGRSRTCKATNGKCLIEKSSLGAEEKKKLTTAYFRPDLPEEWKKKPNTWLDSDNINAVMKQYEASCPHFKFIGVVPIDFSAPDPYAKAEKKCMNQEFCLVDLKAEKAAGKTVLGAVFNLDPHYKGGSHWVGLTIDLVRNKVYYFDSYGMKPPMQVARYMRYLHTLDPSLVLESNGRRFQYTDTECGMYSLYFIICMINGDNFTEFCRNPIADKWMRKYRKVLFSDSK